jgi:hypothetical protein
MYSVALAHDHPDMPSKAVEANQASRARAWTRDEIVFAVQYSLRGLLGGLAIPLIPDCTYEVDQ